MSSERAVVTRQRRPLARPPGLADHVSRAEAAILLGYPSVFRIRELERRGLLTAARGVMGSAWYPRRQVLALREQEVAPTPPAAARPVPGRRRSDAELIAYLRGARSSPETPPRPPTLADLVADTGVSIARAQKVYRFWLAHDAHPAAQQVRSGRAIPVGSPPPADVGARPMLGGAARAGASERRSPARLERAALIRQLRVADPVVRAAAYAALKNPKLPADVP